MWQLTHCQHFNMFDNSKVHRINENMITLIILYFLKAYIINFCCNVNIHVHAVRTLTISRIQKILTIKIEYIIKLFNSSAVSRPEYFFRGAGNRSVFYCPRPTAESNGTHCTLSCSLYIFWSIDCSGNK